MDTTLEFAAALKASLRDCGYSEQTEGNIGGVDYAAVLSTPRRSPTKFVCAVAQVPRGVRGPDRVGEFVTGIRRGLARRFVWFPWFNRLGTFTVLLVAHDLFEELRGQEGRFIDQGGMHVNVLLGTVLVDLDTFQTRADYTWDLRGGGEQFRRIHDSVEDWCSRYRRPNRLVWTRGRAVQVA